MSHVLRRSEPELLQLSVLVIWLGAALFFSAVVAPALFAVLPSRTLAGEVVGRLLPAIFYSGMLVGALVVATQLRNNGSWSWRGREFAGAVTAISCAIAQIVIAPRIDRVRAEIGGPIEILSASDPRRIAFGRLHAASVAWLGIAMLGAIVASIFAVRAMRQSDDIHTL